MNFKTMFVCFLAYFSFFSSSYACGNHCGVDVKASGIIQMSSKKICNGVKEKVMSCIFEYGATFRVLSTEQISHNQWGALLTEGNEYELAMNPETGWAKVYLVEGDYKVFSYDASHPNLVSVTGRLNNSEIKLGMNLSTFKEMSGAKTLKKAAAACDSLMFENN